MDKSNVGRLLPPRIFSGADFNWLMDGLNLDSFLVAYRRLCLDSDGLDSESVATLNTVLMTTTFLR